MKDYVAQDLGGEPACAPAAQMSADRAARLAQLEATISRDRLARATVAASGGAALPPSWRAATNPDRCVYYEHDASGAVQWTMPGSKQQCTVNVLGELLLELLNLA